MNLRTAAISACAIQLSLLAAAIALGEVVDDATVDVENIFRRLRENGSQPDPLPAAVVVWRASLEVRSGSSTRPSSWYWCSCRSSC